MTTLTTQQLYNKIKGCGHTYGFDPIKVLEVRSKEPHEI